MEKERSEINQICLEHRARLSSMYRREKEERSRGLLYVNDFQPFASLQIEGFDFVKNNVVLHARGDISDVIEQEAFHDNLQRLRREERHIGCQLSVHGFYFHITLEKMEVLLAMAQRHGRHAYLRQRNIDRFSSKQSFDRMVRVDRMFSRLNKVWNPFSELREIQLRIPSKGVQGNGGKIGNEPQMASLRESVGRKVHELNDILSELRFPIEMQMNRTRSGRASVAQVYFAASPFLSKLMYIKFDADFSKIPDFQKDDVDLLAMVTTRILSPSTLDAILKDRFGSLMIEKIRNYNVGQGNFSVGLSRQDGEEKPMAVFDIGFTKTESHASYVFAKSALSCLQDDGLVVLSHLDVDHILGSIYASTGDHSVFKRTWVLPELHKDNTQSAKNLVLYLLSENPHRIHFVQDKVSAGLIAGFGNIRLFQGSADLPPGEESSTENIRGLIALVEKNKKCLLPGDCIYPCFQQTFSNLDYLLVPHHACIMTLSNVGFQRGSEALVLVGRNPFKHPNQDTIQDLLHQSVPVWRFDNANVHDRLCQKVMTDFRDFIL